MSVVLENHFDPKYEPSQSEVEEYGKWLGMEFPAHSSLTWIAREGLKAPLPEHWKACKSERGELYYFNFKTGQSMWDHPMDQHYKDLFAREKAKLESAPKDAIPHSADSDSDAGGGGGGGGAVPKKREGSRQKRDQAISFVGESTSPPQRSPAAATTTALLPSAAASVRRPPPSGSQQSSSVDVSDEETPTTTTSTPEVVAEKRTKVAPGTGMGKLAQLKGLKSAHKLPPAAARVSGAPSPTTAAAAKPLAPLWKAGSPEAATPLSAESSAAATAAHNKGTAAATPAVDSLAATTPAHTATMPQLQREAEEKHAQHLKELNATHQRELEQLRSKHSERLAAERAHMETALKEKLHAIQVDLDKELAAAEAKLRAAHTSRVAKLAKEMAEQSNAASKLTKETVSSFSALLTDVAKQLHDLESQYAAMLEDELVNAALRRAQARAAAELQGVEETFRREIAERKLAQADQIQQLALMHASKVSELTQVTQESVDTTQRVRAELDSSLSAMRAQHEAKLAEFRAASEAELRSLREEYAAAVTTARQQHESHLHDVRHELLREYAEAEEQLRRKASAEFDAMVADLGNATGGGGGGSSARSSSVIAGAGEDRSPSGSEGKPPTRMEMTAADGATSPTTNPDTTTSRTTVSRAPPPVAMSIDELQQQAPDATHTNGPLSLLSTNSPASQTGAVGRTTPLPDVMSGDALRDAIVAVIRSLVTDGSLGAPLAASGSVLANTLPTTTERTDAATFMSPYAPTHTDPAPDAPRPPLSGQYHHPFHPVAAAEQGLYQPTPPLMPHSLVEQRRLLERERERLEAAKRFLERQLDGVARQRAALKGARSKWKSDVRSAKAAGASAMGRRADTLRKVHTLLDQQADGLSQDELVLRETQSWLQAKEARLVRLEDLLLNGEDVALALNGSAYGAAVDADTTAMLAAYLQVPDPPLPPLSELDTVHGTHRRPSDRHHHRTIRHHSSRKTSPVQGASHSRPPTPTPALADALLRIESRLAEVTSMVKGGHRSASAAGRPRSPYHRHAAPLTTRGLSSGVAFSDPTDL